MYLEGNGFRRIGRLLGVNHQSVANWVAAASAQVPSLPPQPAASTVIELDELHLYRAEKNEIYVLTAVDRATRCIVAWAVERTRIFEVIQPLVDHAVRAQQYFSDGFPSYADVYYHRATYQALLDKSQTYSLEGDNAELRYSLTHLHRSTRCYSKCVRALQQALALFVTTWNRRQWKRHAYPNSVGTLSDLVSVRV